MLEVKLQDIMSDNIVTIDEEATVKQAAHLLLRFQINGILVRSKDDKDNVVGILTTTDLLKLLDRALSRPGNRMTAMKELSELQVLRFASKEVVKVQKDTKISRVAAIMHKRNIHTIPIYDGARLIGVVGRHDILNAVLS